MKTKQTTYVPLGRILVGIMIVVAIVGLFVGIAHAQNGTDTTSTSTTSAGQPAAPQPSPDKVTMEVNKSDFDKVIDAETKGLTGRENVIAFNVLAHQARVDAENEKIFSAMREVLRRTHPEMIKDLEMWYNINLGHPKLGDLGPLKPLEERSIPTKGMDPNFAKIVDGLNGDMAAQKQTADKQIAVDAYEITWLECYRQFLERLVQLLDADQASAPVISSGGGGSIGASVSGSSEGHGTDVVLSYSQDWGYGSVPQVINTGNGANVDAQTAFDPSIK